MNEIGISNYSDINLENIKKMSENFSIKDFFNDSFQGIAVIIITPNQYIAVYTNEKCEDINHDQIVELCLSYFGKEYNKNDNPRIVFELTHFYGKNELNQYIVQLPCTKIVPITDKMNRLKFYIDYLVNRFQPDDILSDVSKDFLFVKKSDRYTYPKEKIIGIPIDKQCSLLRKLYSKLHEDRQPHVNIKNKYEPPEIKNLEKKTEI